MTDALTIVGAFFATGIATMLVCLLIANIFKNKDYGIDEGHVVLSVILGIMSGLLWAGVTAGRLWF